MCYRVSLALFIVGLTIDLNVVNVLAQPREAQALTAEDLVGVRDIKAMSVSPDGKYVAYQVSEADHETNSYTLSWFAAPASAQGRGAPKFIADGGEPIFHLSPNASVTGRNGQFVATPPVWSPDSKRFAYALQKDEEVQIWVSRVERRGQSQLTHNAGNVRALLGWSEDNKIIYKVDRLREEKIRFDEKGNRQGYRVKADIFSAYIDMPTLKPCHSYAPPTANSEAMGILDDEQSCIAATWAYDFTRRKAHSLTPNDTAHYEALFRQGHHTVEKFNLTKHPRHMLTVSNEGERAAWAEIIDPDVYKGALGISKRLVAKAGAGEKKTCVSVLCESKFFKNMWWEEEASTIYFLVGKGPKSSTTYLNAWNIQTGEVRNIVKSEDRINGCSYLDGRLICRSETWISPNKIISIDMATGTQTILADPNPKFQAKAFTKIEKLTWKDKHGNMALAHLVYPKNYQRDRAYPIIITTYRSGGFLRGATGDEHPIHVYAQNEKFVLSYDIPEDESKYLKAEGLERSVAGFQYDVLEMGSLKALDIALDQLIDSGMVDPDRIGFTAFSYGYNLLQLALVNNHRFAAASTAWASDLRSTFHFRLDKNLKIAKAVYGEDSVDENAEIWDRISVSKNAATINMPLLIQVADREYFGTLPTFLALKDKNKPVDMYRFPDAYHIKWQPAQKHAVYVRNIDWFNFWLRGVEDSDPAKADQYAHWRKLRDDRCAALKPNEKGPWYCQEQPPTQH